MDVWQPAYVGVGSNLNGPRSQVLRAFDSLASIPTTRLVMVSRLYASEPLGTVQQPEFVNAVAGLLTQLDAAAFLQELRDIEAAFGRPPLHERWGPRVLDLDILVFARETRHDSQLTLPHPGVVQRNFVLYPLADIAPDLEVPGHGRVAELKGRVAASGLRIL